MTVIHENATEAPAPKVPTPRAGTKQATLIAMLRAPDGATMEAIIAVTGWLLHYADVRIMPTCACNLLCGVRISEKGSA